MTEPDARDERLRAVLDGVVRDLEPVADAGAVMRSRSRLPRIAASIGVAAVFVALAVVAASVVRDRGAVDVPDPSSSVDAAEHRYPDGWRSVYNTTGRVAVVAPGDWLTWIDHELPLVFDANVQPILGLASGDAGRLCGGEHAFFGGTEPAASGETAIGVIEWIGGGWGNPDPPPFPPRPQHVAFEGAQEVEQVTCASGVNQEIRTFRFEDAGRLITVRVGTEPDPDAGTIADVERVLTSLWFARRLEGAGFEEGPVRYADPVEGMSVEVPAGWRVSDENLTPWLAEPREILSMGTWFDMEVSEDPDDELRVFDAPVAPSALAHLRPSDAFVSVQASGPSDGPDDRPIAFRTGEGRPCCSGETGDYPFTWWWVPFTDGGRGFYLFVAIGNEASPEVVDQAWQVADSLRFEPATTPAPAPSGAP